MEQFKLKALYVGIMTESLPPPRRISYVSVVVCLLATLRKNF